MPQGDVRVSDFSTETLKQIIGAPEPADAAVDYLQAYLVALNAQAVVEELHYVDRHYLEDFSEHYARAFNAPATSCRRLHFFDLPTEKIEAVLEAAYGTAGAHHAAESDLQKAYLGFVVVRPLANAPIGRTVLKTYPVDGRRHYTVVRHYAVQFAGLNLSIDGLAYQQQDGSAAVCASIALWSALQSVADLAGNRTPTPSAITRAARCPFPANVGLDYREMAAALSALGYVADAFEPGANRAEFRSRLVACLASRLPVVLLISRLRHSEVPGDESVVREGHAVCVTGYSEPSTVVEVSPPIGMAIDAIRSKDASVKVLYVHDDNVGSHVHYEIEDSDERDELGNRRLVLFRGRTDGENGSWMPADRWVIDVALIPKPPKLRMPIDTVVHDVIAVRHVFGLAFGGLPLHFSARFDTGARYKRALLEAEFPVGTPNKLSFSTMRPFQSLATLPRFVGIISVSDDAGLLCDVVTDVSHDAHRREPTVLALVAVGVDVGSRAWMVLSRAAQVVYKCPIIGATPPPATGTTA